jgi:hypothetical protein
MSVKKTGSVWSFRISAGVDTRTGKRKQVYRSGYKTKCEALDEMNKLQTQILMVSIASLTEPFLRTIFKAG